jgi:hypothetical protein
MRRLDSIAVLSCLAALAGAACHGGGRDGLPHASGSESFDSPPPGGRAGSALDTAGAAPAGAPASPAAAGATAPRAIEEADIYKRVGATLYVLNAYRGLEVVDLTDLSAPRVVSRLPVGATPVDLYVRGSTALVVVNDWFAYVAAEDGARPERGSRVLAVDVSDPAHPAVAAEFAVDGEIEQTRLVGDVLYVVSRTYPSYEWLPIAAVSGVAGAAGVASPAPDTAFVASFDVADPLHPIAVARVDFPAGGWTAHACVTSERVTLSFAGWEGDGAGGYGPVTRFRVLDISDPGGALKLGADFSTRGLVQDRWAMDFDQGTGLFRAVLASDWNGGAAVALWSSPTPDAATPLSRLALDVPEALTAARFDGARVYVVTARRTDPLWAVDASDPRNPVLAGSLSMPGQLDFIEPRGDRLVALGHTSEAGLPFQLAVSLLDVADLAAPKLLARVPFGASWGSVNAQPDDVRKAFIVLDPPPAGAGLVLVPVQGWDQTTYAFAGGTQLIDLSRDGLALRGFLGHPGAVKRSFPLDDAGARLVSLSDSALQTVDASNRDAPRELARLDLARSVSALALAHGKAVELSGDWYRGDVELAVTDALDPDAASPLARVKVAAPSARMFQDGDVLWLLASDYASGQAWIEAVDVSDPVHPAHRGRLALSGDDALGVFPGEWFYGDEAVLVGHALAIHRSSWLCRGVCLAGGGGSAAGELRILDLSDPDEPRLAAAVAIPDSSWAWGLYAAGSYLWLTHFEWHDGDDLGRYYVDRVDLSDPAHPRLLPKLNVPGVFFAASPDGRALYTLETWWPSNGSTPTTWLHALDLTARGTARLRGSANVGGYPSGVAAAGGFAWVATTDGSGSTSRTRLAAVDLGTVSVTSDQAVEGGWAWVRAAAGGKLFVEASWQDQGLLIYGLADPAHPAFERFYRTPSWVWDIVVDGGRAYLPSGPYGVPVVDLSAP